MDDSTEHWADLNVCAICGGRVQGGIRLMHEDGGPLCLPCARTMYPDVVAEHEGVWALFPDGPDVEVK
jgi:hypothetical protein